MCELKRATVENASSVSVLSNMYDSMIVEQSLIKKKSGTFLIKNGDEYHAKKFVDYAHTHLPADWPV